MQSSESWGLKCNFSYVCYNSRPKAVIELYFVKTDYQQADIFTKALPTDRFNYLVRRLGMRSLSPQELERLAKSQTFRVILFSIHNDEWKYFQSQHQIALRIRRWRYNLIRVESRFKTSCSINKDTFKMKAQVAFGFDVTIHFLIIYNQSLTFGLKINIIKSSIMGIGTTGEEVNSAAKIIGCSTFSSPFKYLGVKVGSASSRNSLWDEVISKIASRLSKWKAKSLSIGDRFTLIKSVLTSLPLFFMSIYKAPMGVLHKLESIRRNLFNGLIIMKEKST
nr:RNA-directed DNA polymerase, eukaryota, reverse transcriptase zinc-binding domain protein [Tanacetum cinerariifolium]